MGQRIINFDKLEKADLIVDAVYEGGNAGNTGDDPIHPLLQVGNQGGFRYLGNTKEGKYSLVVIYSSSNDLDWPDLLDTETGIFIYYGDNKHPGSELLDTKKKGNKLLQNIFSYAHGSREIRRKVPPVFIFTKGGKGRDVVFRGLAIPGGKALSQTEDLVAVWKSKNGVRFQNYRAMFTILNEGTISRQWIDEIIAGDAFSDSCPSSFKSWIEGGKYEALIASKSVIYRKKAEQIPQNAQEEKIIKVIKEKFKANPYDFEKCAAAIVRLMDNNIVELDLTRPWMDGGRDAIGKYRIGTENNAIHVEFALEAKCYDIKNSVGVKGTSRLISRLRFRQFGILVTTSYVHEQAYKEITSDAHPVIILSATDIAKILINHGYGNIDQLKKWLNTF